MTKNKLIEDNMSLVYFIINKYYPTYIKDEDIVQAGMLGLCKAADTWNEDKGAFSTYAAICIRNNIRMEFRGRGKHQGVLSLDYELPETEDGAIITLGDMVADERYSPEKVSTLDYDTFYDSLTDDEKKILDLSKNGLLQEEMATELGLTRSAVSMRKRTLKRKWRKYNDREYKD